MHINYFIVSEGNTGLNYKDYPKTYGALTAIREFAGNIIAVMEHGVLLIPVNERSLSGAGAGGATFINTSITLPDNPMVLSTNFPCSQWAWMPNERSSLMKKILSFFLSFSLLFVMSSTAFAAENTANETAVVTSEYSMVQELKEKELKSVGLYISFGELFSKYYK